MHADAHFRAGRWLPLGAALAWATAAWAGDLGAPLTGWLEGVAESAVALSAGDAGRAELAARAALAAVPAGVCGARADLALGLALREARRPAEAAEALRRALPR